MSINLRFQKGSMIMQASLKDEALPGLLQLISEHQSDEVQTTTVSQMDVIRPVGDKPSADRIEGAKALLAKLSGSELLNHTGWDTNPEKILLLAAHHEALGAGEAWRSADMEARFAAAKEPPPANFPRDIASAIKAGIIATVTPRTYRVSRTGWNKVADAIEKFG